MCPLRFILVFLSAMLAGYVAWRTASSTAASSDVSQMTDASETTPPPQDENQNRDLIKTMIQNGFWTFVDMASGRYLWRNLNASLLNKNQAKKLESN